MTCIVGMIDRDVVWMGGDSAGISGLDITQRADPKVFRKGDMLIGYTSSFRMGQLLRFSLCIPLHAPGKDTFEYMATDFIGAVRQCLREGGYTTISNNTEEAGFFMVAYMGRLFVVESDLQISERAEPYESIGCGASYALGSLYTTIGEPPEQRLRTALEAAAHFSAGVREPFVVERLTL